MEIESIRLDIVYRINSDSTIGNHPREISKYFKENIEELEYFGSYFGCEPCGGINSDIKLIIID